MTITPTKLTRASSLAAVAAGTLFIVIQFIHPHESVAAVTTTRWAVTHALGVTMSALALAGVTGIYLRQVRQAGLLGLVGFLLFGGFWLLTLPFQFLEAFVSPALAHQAPQFVRATLAISTGDTIVGDAGSLPAIYAAVGALYMLGGLTFGVALYRARVLARWAAVLLTVATAVTPVLVQVLPHSLARMAALPVGVALIGLGYSLWLEQGTTTSIEPATGVRGTSLNPAVAE